VKEFEIVQIKDQVLFKGEINSFFNAKIGYLEGSLKIL
jgi:hypothetical protein